jgi:hypothetical protein
VIYRRLLDGGQTGITRTQLDELLDAALGEAPLTQEQAQRMIAQRLKAAGHKKVTNATLDALLKGEIQKQQQSIDRVVDKIIHRGQEPPMANQGRPATQAAPPSRPTPRPSNPDPDGTYGTKGRQDNDATYGTIGRPGADTTDGTKGPDMSRHMRPG